jgi:hypothetical protein
MTGFESKRIAAQEIEIAELKNSLAMAKQTKTLRDELAMATMHRIMIHSGWSQRTASDLAGIAYFYADAMLRERAKPIVHCWGPFSDEKVMKKEMSKDWQPIETAPKDGTVIIGKQLGDETGDCIALIFWHKTHRAEAWAHSLGVKVKDGKQVKDNHSVIGLDGISLWMPLPEPLKTTEGE